VVCAVIHNDRVSDTLLVEEKVAVSEECLSVDLIDEGRVLAHYHSESENSNCFIL